MMSEQRGKNLHNAMELLLLLLLGGWLCALPSGAQSETVHEAHVYPGADLVKLEISTEPPADRELIQTVTTVPPSFGTLTGLTYEPGEEFWNIGADRLTVRVSSGPNAGNHTFLLSLLKPKLNSIDTETFESGTWDWCLADTDSSDGCSDDPSPVLLVVGSGPDGYSLKATVIDDDTTDGVVNPGSFAPPSGAGITGHGGAGGTMIEPPGGARSPGTADEIVIASLGDIKIQLGVETDAQGIDTYRMRAVASGEPAEDCVTDWFEVPTSTHLDFQLWSGAKSLQSSYLEFSNLESIRFDVTPEGGSTQSESLEGHCSGASYALKVGILESSAGMAGTEVYFDNLEVFKEQYTFTAKNHRNMTFEDAEIGDWQAHGAAGSISSSAISGDWSWSVDAGEVAASGEDSILVDTGPGEQPAAGVVTHGAALFRVDLSGLNLAVGDSIQLLRGSSSDSIDGGLHLSLLLQRSTAGLRMRIRARDDQHLTQQAPWHLLSGTGPFDVAVRWQAATEPGASDGQVHLWVDGLPAGGRKGIDNDLKFLEAFAFGAHRSTLTGHASPDYGTFILDDLATFPEPE